MMHTLRLSDGTEYACDWCAPSGSRLIFNLPDETDFLSLVTALNDPMKTRCMTWIAGTDHTYCGYTVIAFMQRNGWPTGGILVMMEQEA